MRIPQKAGGKGSLKWMQVLTASADSPLTARIREELAISPDASLQWKSPRADDEHAEYRDGGFLAAVGLSHLAGELTGFWPSRGPQWDGLAVASDGKVILVEAKSHVSELVSSCAAGSDSRTRIEQSLDKAKRYFRARRDADWTTGFYQYANRLAHLYFLRKQGVDAHLVFVYFLNDLEMRGPDSIAQWANVLDECYDRLGLKRETGIPGVHSIYVNVAGLKV
jgi:hypothetical protein